MKRMIAALTIVLGLASPAMAFHGHHHHHSGRGASPEIAGLVTSVAQENGLSPALVHAVVRIESGYNCNAHNGAAAGIMQTNVRTARSMGVTGSLSSCRNGLVAGVRYLKSAIAMHGYGCAAFSAYQSGTGVHRCSAYGRRVMAMIGHSAPAPAPALAQVASLDEGSAFGLAQPITYRRVARHHGHFRGHRYANHVRHHHSVRYASR